MQTRKAKQRMKLLSALALGSLILVTACSDKDQGEPEAARTASIARDLEGDIDQLDAAMATYQKIAADYANTPTGKRCSERYAELASIRPMLEAFKTAEEDSIPAVSMRILRKAPNYEPVLYRLGSHYADRSKLYTRAAATYKDEAMANRLLRVWNFQDSLWAAYPFRPTHEDRGMRDVLCRHAINVGLMLKAQKRYQEAQVVLDRGITFGNNKDLLAEAKVYGAFYRFRNGESDAAFKVAGEALENEDLDKKLRAQAHHVQGLILTYRYQDNKQIADLENAIESLNEAVGLDPGIGDARDLLRELRKTLGKLQTS